MFPILTFLTLRVLIAHLTPVSPHALRCNVDGTGRPIMN
jgi:hypothetical protein